MAARRRRVAWRAWPSASCHSCSCFVCDCQPVPVVLWIHTHKHTHIHTHTHSIYTQTHTHTHTHTQYMHTQHTHIHTSAHTLSHAQTSLHADMHVQTQTQNNHAVWRTHARTCLFEDFASQPHGAQEVRLSRAFPSAPPLCRQDRGGRAASHSLIYI